MKKSLIIDLNNIAYAALFNKNVMEREKYHVKNIDYNV